MDSRSIMRNLLVSQPLDVLGFVLFDQLRLRCGGDQRFRVVGREFVHRDHQLGRLDLPQRQHFPEFGERVDCDVLVLENFGYLGADSIQQASLSNDALNIDVERFRNPLLGHASFYGFDDHPVLLNHRKPVDALVVGEGLIVGRNEANDLGLPRSFRTSIRRWPSSRRYLPGSLRSRATTGGSTMPTSRMDAAIWAYFGVFLTAGGHELQGMDLGDGNAAVASFSKPSSTVDDRHFRAMFSLGLQPRMRVAMFLGSVSSPSARNSVMKFSSPKSLRKASVTNTSRLRVARLCGSKAVCGRHLPDKRE